MMQSRRGPFTDVESLNGNRNGYLTRQSVCDTGSGSTMTWVLWEPSEG